MHLTQVVSMDGSGFYAPTPMGKTRRITHEGYLVCEGVRIARTGEMLYHESDFEGQSEDEAIKGDAHGMIRVKRDPVDVFHPDTLASFHGKPVTVEHPNEFVGTDNFNKLSVGTVFNPRRGEGLDDQYIMADLLITEPDAIQYVNSKLPQLSAGYTATYEQEEPGVARQVNILGNHVALVDRGRAGPRVAINDSLSQPEKSKMTMLQRMRAMLTKANVPATDHDSLISDALTDGTPPTTTTDSGALAAIMQKLATIDAELKAMKDKQTADETAEKEAKDAAEKEAKDAAEAEEKEKAAKDAMSEEEETGDMLIETEVTGKTLNMGAVYSGLSGNYSSMTGDSASKVVTMDKAAVRTAIASRLESLVPGFVMPTNDELKGTKGAALAAVLRTALAQVKDRATVDTFLMGRDLKTLKGHELVGVFNGAAALAKTNATKDSMRFTPGVKTGDFGKKKTPADINAAARDFWKQQAK